jgi:hypothetical protein
MLKSKEQQKQLDHEIMLNQSAIINIIKLLYGLPVDDKP